MIQKEHLLKRYFPRQLKIPISICSSLLLCVHIPYDSKCFSVVIQEFVFFFFTLLFVTFSIQFLDARERTQHFFYFVCELFALLFCIQCCLVFICCLNLNIGKEQQHHFCITIDWQVQGFFLPDASKLRELINTIVVCAIANTITVS